MSIPLYIVNAFTTDTFGGNPAAVCPLNEWLSDDVMQDMAAQHNLSETAFFAPSQSEGVDYHIRWFTPTKEVDLCGHATLASSHVIFDTLDCEKSTIVFECQVGRLVINKLDNGKIQMDFPKNASETQGLMATFGSLCGAQPIAAYAGTNAQPDLVLIYANEAQVRDAIPNFHAMKTLPYRCIIASAAADEVGIDFVCRVFAPRFGIEEDPVTGSAYTVLAPIWADKLGKTAFVARQVSQRGGDVWCEMLGERVMVSGFAKLYGQGEIFL